MVKYFCDICGAEKEQRTRIVRFDLEMITRSRVIYETCPECQEKARTIDWNKVIRSVILNADRQ